MLGWIALMSRPSLRKSVFVQVLPRSAVRSNCTRHLLGFSGVSMLDPQSSEPSASCTGLFFTGPTKPSGSAVASSERVAVNVDDNGPGLSKGREETIFQMFERGRKESATPGVGLGLAICRAIVEAHGGTIRGETRAQGGARFTFELPRGEPPKLDDLEGVAQIQGETHE